MKSESGGLPTGGMGSICPVPLQKEVADALVETIIEPTLYGLKAERMAYKGVLTISVINENGPMLLTTTCASTILPHRPRPLIKTDIFDTSLPCSDTSASHP